MNITTPNITFQGINGQVISSSNHGNYLIVKLSERITICGTYSNKWEWGESPDLSSGFSSFITYIGFESEDEFDQAFVNLMNWLELNNGSFDYRAKNDALLRESKRCSTPLEVKIRDLPAESIPNLINLMGGQDVFC